MKVSKSLRRVLKRDFYRQDVLPAALGNDLTISCHVMFGHLPSPGHPLLAQTCPVTCPPRSRLPVTYPLRSTMTYLRVVHTRDCTELKLLSVAAVFKCLQTSKCHVGNNRNLESPILHPGRSTGDRGTPGHGQSLPDAPRPLSVDDTCPRSSVSPHVDVLPPPTRRHAPPITRNIYCSFEILVFEKTPEAEMTFEGHSMSSAMTQF